MLERCLNRTFLPLGTVSWPRKLRPECIRGYRLGAKRTGTFAHAADNGAIDETQTVRPLVFDRTHAVRLLLQHVLVCLVFVCPAAAANSDAKVSRALKNADLPVGVLQHTSIGVTAQGTSIPCLITKDSLDYNSTKLRILIIGGLEASDTSVQATCKAINSYYRGDWAKPLRSRFSVSAVPIADPDGWAKGQQNRHTWRGYPPQGGYDSKSPSPEAVSLWRWIGMSAPDLVVVVRGARDEFGWNIPQDSSTSLQRLKPYLPAGSASERPASLSVGRPRDNPPASETHDLAIGLTKFKPAHTGTVPAVVIHTAGGEFLQQLLAAIAKAEYAVPSKARRELQHRLDRSSIELAKQLSKYYGHELNSVAYIPALALIGRLRLGELSSDSSHLTDVERIVEPYLLGEKSSLPKRMSGSILSGHLVFAELARMTGNRRYVELARTAAELGFDQNRKPKQSMPFHNEMSDSVFMGCPILVQVGRLTGETRFYDMALRHMQFMLKLNLRKDGLHRHSPLDETAWGRGNGFPALGLALSLSDLPSEHSGRNEMLAAFRDHIQALVIHQDPTGTWHQVIDHPGSYREMSSTCMITFAMIRGVRSGWLGSKQYAPIIEKAWQAILTRVAADGTLVDVCTGTGKQQNLRAYLDRRAILGRDARGGAMALMVSTEMAKWQAESLRR